ncbi:MAG: MlaD family protein [Persicimonas sp.]
MATRSQKVKLGIFLTAGIVLLAGSIAAISGIGLFRDRVPYFVEFRQTVAGLEEGAPVTLQGVNVGTVAGIRVHPSNSDVVEVRIRVDRNTPIREDTKAYINMQGVTGLKFIELDGGTPEADLLEPGSEIAAGRSMMEQLTGQASDIGLKVEKLLNNALYLTRETNRERVDEVLVNAESSSQDLSKVSEELRLTLESTRQVVEENREPVTELIARTNRTSEKTDKVMTELQELTRLANRALAEAEIPEAVGELRETNAMIQERLESFEMGETIEMVTAALDRLTAFLDDLSTTVDQNKDQLRATIQNMRVATESFKELARSLERNPSRLFFGDDPPDRKLP